MVALRVGLGLHSAHSSCPVERGGEGAFAEAAELAFAEVAEPAFAEVEPFVVVVVAFAVEVAWAAFAAVAFVEVAFVEVAFAVVEVVPYVAVAASVVVGVDVAAVRIDVASVVAAVLDVGAEEAPVVLVETSFAAEASFVEVFALGVGSIGVAHSPWVLGGVGTVERRR